MLVSQYMLLKFIFYYRLSQDTMHISWKPLLYLTFACSCITSVVPVIAAPAAGAGSAKSPHLPLTFEAASPFLLPERPTSLTSSVFWVGVRCSSLPAFNLHPSDLQCVGHRWKAAAQLGCLVKFRFLDPILKKRWFGGSDLVFFW